MLQSNLLCLISAFATLKHVAALTTGSKTTSTTTSHGVSVTNRPFELVAKFKPKSNQPSDLSPSLKAYDGAILGYWITDFGSTDPAYAWKDWTFDLVFTNKPKILDLGVVLTNWTLSKTNVTHNTAFYNLTTESNSGTAIPESLVPFLFVISSYEEMHMIRLGWAVNSPYTTGMGPADTSVFSVNGTGLQWGLSTEGKADPWTTSWVMCENFFSNPQLMLRTSIPDNNALRANCAEIWLMPRYFQDR